MSHGPRQQRNWDWRAAGNFILGGSGSGLLIYLALHSAITPLPHLAPLAAGLIACGLLLVWLEIGRPTRALNVLRNAPSSWMTREAYLAAVVIPFALLAWLLQSPGSLFISAAAAAGFIYAQACILNAAVGTPAWRAPEIPWLIISCGLAEGLALATPLWLSGLIPLKSHALPWALLLGAVLLRALTWVRYWQGLNRKGAPQGTLQALRPVNLELLLGGTLLPLLLGFFDLLPGAIGELLLALTAFAILASGWHLKYVLVVKAAYSQGFSVPHAPARGGGKSGPGIKSGWTLPQ